MKTELENVLQKHRYNFHRVVDFDAANDKLYPFDFTAANQALNTAIITDTARFSQYVNKKLESHHAKFGIGGYNENRNLYKRSSLFSPVVSEVSTFGEDLAGLNRSIHLGIDIWGPAGTKVFLPVGGMVHSFAFNDNFGDYGATIIVQHQLDTIAFHTLYGHVSLNDIAQLHPGKYVNRGEVIAHFGESHENGNWPPHLHFQIIGDMNLKEGDYPGVCSMGDREKYLTNCPDPDLMLNMMHAVKN